MPAHATFVGGPLAGKSTPHVVRCLDSSGVPVGRDDLHTDTFADCYHRFRDGRTHDAPILYLWGAVLDARFAPSRDQPR